MPFLAILHAIIAVVSVVLVCICILKCSTPHMRLFTLYALCVSVFAVCYYFILVSSSQSAALTAHQIHNIATPFTAGLFFLFINAYCETPIKKPQYIAFIFAFPCIIALLIQIQPFQHLYFSNYIFTNHGSFSLLYSTPGSLYYAFAAYSAVIIIITLITILRYARLKGLRNVRILLICTILPVLAAVLHIFNILPLGYSPLAATLLICASIMFWHIIHHRQKQYPALHHESILQNLKDAFILIDAQGSFLDANSMAKRYFPSLANAQKSQVFADIPSLPPALYSKYSEDSCFIHEFEGDTLYLRISRSPLSCNGTVYATSIMVYDDTENRDTIEKLQDLATHDALTGLYNRGTFFSFATRDFDLCVRKREAGSVLMLDIDHFKQVNDLHGHTWGDKVLISIARVLNDRLRHTDMSGRYGGEELVVWLPGAGLDEAAIIADVIRRAVEHTIFTSADGIFSVTISIGVSGINYSYHQTFDDIINEADTALYKAKQTGRNRVCSYVHTGGT